MTRVEGRERGSEHTHNRGGDGGPERAPAQSPCWEGGPRPLAPSPRPEARLSSWTPGWPLLIHPLLAPHSPVALPGVADVRVVDAVLVRLLIQEVKHVLDRQGQGGAAVRRAEDGLEEVVHKLLQCALWRRAQVRTQLACPVSSEAGF